MKQEEPAQEKVTTHSIGDTVETDIARFTLDRAELTIALENSGAATVGYGADGHASDDYFMPKEYNAEEDSDNPYVAAKGHTLISLTFTAENLDRDFLELDNGFPETFFAVEYDGTACTENADYDGDLIVQYGAENSNGNGWNDYGSKNILMAVGETSSYKCYIDVPIDIEDMTGAYKLTINLPNSEGKTTPFTFVINE